MKKLLISLFLITLIIGSVLTYSYLQNQTKKREAEQTKILLADINEGINLMDAFKDEMPKELLEVHRYLMSRALGNKLYNADSKLKEVVMYHDAKLQSVYVNTDIKLNKELWIPIFYHEVAHNYWHTKNPVNTSEEFRAQLFNSENYAYTVNAQAWDLVMKHYPVKEEDLKTDIEQRLFKNYTQQTDIYNWMMNNEPDAKVMWNKIIEADIKEQEKQQKLLSGK
jgi:hypothetical protein